MKKVCYYYYSSLSSVIFYLFQLYGKLFIELLSIKWWNYKAVRRNRLMQSWLNNLPAIQTGMLVVSAVTFHSTGSEVWPRQRATTSGSGSSEVVSPLGTFLTVKTTVTFPNRRSGSSAADSSNEGRNLTLS